MHKTEYLKAIKKLRRGIFLLNHAFLYAASSTKSFQTIIYDTLTFLRPFVRKLRFANGEFYDFYFHHFVSTLISQFFPWNFVKHMFNCWFEDCLCVFHGFKIMELFQFHQSYFRNEFKVIEDTSSKFIQSSNRLKPITAVSRIEDFC